MSQKKIQADPVTFPSGMKTLGEYIHSKGLKYGIYSDAGTLTCAGRPGSLYLEEIDAPTYASWEVDYLKYDSCNTQGVPSIKRFSKMRDELNKTGRPIYYSLCEGGRDEIWKWGANVGNSWRTNGDLHDNWKSMIENFEIQASFSNSGGPGAWNDPDMLEVGNGGMTTIEYQTHFALWAIVKAPLLIGCDITTMSKETFNILSNTELIAVNQDPLGKPAERFLKRRHTQVWGGPVKDGYVVALLNTGERHNWISADFGLFGLDGTYTVRDLILHQDIGTFKKKFSSVVEPHGVVVVKLTRKREVTEGELNKFLTMENF